MNEVLSSQERPSHPPQDKRHWPWGQVAVFLFGISMCLTIDPAAIDIIEMAVIWGFEKLKWIGLPCVLAALVCAVNFLVVQRRVRNEGSEILQVPWLRKASITVWSTYLLVMLLSMLIPAFVSAYQAAQRAESQKLESGPWNVHSFANDSFQLSTPSNWELVAVATLVDCRPMSVLDEPAAQCRKTPTAIAWVLENVRRIKKPFPVQGELRVFEVDVTGLLELAKSDS